MSKEIELIRKKKQKRFTGELKSDELKIIFYSKNLNAYFEALNRVLQIIKKILKSL